MKFTDDEIKRAKSRDLKIWVIGTNEEDFVKRHKTCQYYGKYNIDISQYPDIYQKFITTKEYDEDNINQYSKFFNELVGMYYVWKNKKSKYVGFSHYRRVIPLSFVDFEELDKNKIQVFSIFYNSKHSTAPIIKDILKHKYTYLYGLSRTVDAGAPYIYEDIENYLDSQTIISQDVLENYCSFHNSLVETSFVARNIFVCKWEEFDKMMQFLIGYFEFILKTHNIHSEEEFKNFYKDNIINYYITNWDTFASKGYWFTAGKHNKKEYAQLLSKTGGYEVYPTLPYWRAIGYMIEILMSVYITSTGKRTTPRIIELQQSQNLEYNYNLKIYKHLKENPNLNNILVISENTKLAEILHYYNIKSNNSNNIKFVLPKRTFKCYSVEDEYLMNYMKDNQLSKNDNLLNDIDLIILDDLYYNAVNLNLLEIINNLNKQQYNIIILHSTSLHYHDNLLETLKKLEYDISIKKYYISRNNIFIISLNKKGEV